MTESVKKISKTVCIAFPDRDYCRKCIEHPETFRKFMEKSYEEHPELFPKGFEKGFTFHGSVISRKQNGFTMRRIRLKNETGDVYQIRPSFMMPYMIAETEEAEKALYLRRRGVPFDALAYVFGRNEMFWYRAYVSLGRNSVVGTSVSSPSLLPGYLIADEKHTRQSSEKVYAAAAVAQGCILGSGLAENAGTEALTEACRDFQEEARELAPSCQPETVNTDGWDATRKAWMPLFPTAVIILCFLRSFLKIRERCRKTKEILREVGRKVWNACHSDTLAQFSQRIRRLRE